MSANCPISKPRDMHSSTMPKDNSLFYRIRRGIQPLLDLVRLLPELLQWTWIIRCVGPTGSPKSIVLRAKVITGGAPYLSHGRSWLLMQRKVASGNGICTVNDEDFPGPALGEGKKAKNGLGNR